jgi:hypothetical protein
LVENCSEFVKVSGFVPEYTTKPFVVLKPKLLMVWAWLGAQRSRAARRVRRRARCMGFLVR